jgi:hypothetical protein
MKQIGQRSGGEKISFDFVIIVVPVAPSTSTSSAGSTFRLCRFPCGSARRGKTNGKPDEGCPGGGGRRSRR